MPGGKQPNIRPKQNTVLAGGRLSLSGGSLSLSGGGMAEDDGAAAAAGAPHLATGRRARRAKRAWKEYGPGGASSEGEASLSPRTLSLFYIENTSVHRKVCRRMVSHVSLEEVARHSTRILGRRTAP